MRRVRDLVVLAGSLALLVSGCGRLQPSLLQPNQPPEVELFARRLDRAATGSVTYRFSWSAHDPDGAVDHFLFSVGPLGEDDATRDLQRTTERRTVLRLPRTAAAGVADAHRSVEPRVFTIQAVDGAGARSAPARVAMFDGNIAPRVRITQPPPNALIRYYLPPTVCFEWTGEDPDGTTGRPIKYRYKLLTDQTEVSLTTARSKPDSVRRYYAPLNWAGWDSTSAETTHVAFTNLVPDQEYVFVVTCVDEMGDYDPLFSFDTNMIYMRCVAATNALPVLALFNEYFLYQYDHGSFDSNPALTIETPAGSPLRFDWYALPAHDNNGNIVGPPVQDYRWALDIADLADETPRSDEERDLAHWSRWGTATFATLPPIYPTLESGESHQLYVEARAVACGASPAFVCLGTVGLHVVQPTFRHDLLIVDDTRLLLDKIGFGTDCYSTSSRPSGNWPTQAELDTFLYARGGVPWRCYPPAGTVLSTPGIFAGYPFDTVGTNLRIADLTIPLSTLSQYRRVIWLVDGAAAFNVRPGTDTGDLAGPMTSMRYMNDNRKANTLAAYVAEGGRLWLAGGGAATASMVSFNRGINDNTLPNPRTITFRNADGELVPGRFVYDQAHWRSEFKQYRINGGRIRRHLGRFESDPGVYAGLPAEIQIKSAATDPFPPNRVGQPGSNFYQTQFYAEFLSAPNEIVEGPPEDSHSALDTLYKVTAGALQPDTGLGAVQSVVMTRYHGVDNTEFILTGFSLWNFQRAQCEALVDFVLQQLWGLPRNGPPAPVLAPRSPRYSPGRQPGIAPRSRAGAPRAAPTEVR